MIAGHLDQVVEVVAFQGITEGLVERLSESAALQSDLDEVI